MSHVDPEVIALLALGEGQPSDAERMHLAHCGQCRADLAMLTATASVGRSTVVVDRVESPSPEVWDRIAHELGLDGEGRPGVEPTSAPVVPLRRRRRILPVLIGASAAAVVAVVAVVGWQILRPLPTVQVASATLEPFPAWPTSSGTATVLELPDGTRELHVDLDAPEEADGYREAWLISTDGSKLVSLGVIDGSAATFVVPRAIDLGEFSLVDVSLERADGDPGHSGDSIVRGPLASSGSSRPS
ncbi:anti-sigma factor [Salinibacterium soli]|uniref:Anti-sigma factor n=1 Tax=Antiquaquibacter soli TaxID=3064523 RepID=A0ABT9BL97_9MICO|nr:anti-sigma factor [Protaetiibacter sp. WY-16]MDO7881793.1 anti-sigma factor [Protaetiibacter sp. WY-16]